VDRIDSLSKHLDGLLKLLAVLGGSGGVMYWVDRFRNRTKLRVRIMQERFGGLPADLHLLSLEIVNIGRDPTSLEPTVVMSGGSCAGCSGSAGFRCITSAIT